MGFSLITLVRLGISILLPVLASGLLFLLDKKTKFAKIRDSYKQIIIGLVFGLIAISATEYGVPVDGGVLNVRNASPLSAGLIFGWQSGLIAGFIGGIQRIFSTTGDFTRIACTLGTIIAGFIGAVIRRFMLDNRKSSWFYGLLIGIVTEVLHMLMVFLINFGDIQRAYTIVEICAIPMIVSTGISVMLSILLVTLISTYNGRLYIESGKKNISQTFRFWLFVCVVCAFCVTTMFTNAFQKSMARATTEDTLISNLDDIKKDVKEAANRKLIQLTKEIALEIKETPTTDFLRTLILKYDLAEINLINKEGVVVYSSEPSLIGFNMNYNDKSRNFLVLLKEKTEYVQEHTESIDELSYVQKYVGIAGKEGFIQIGFSDDQFQKVIGENIIHVAQYRHVGIEGSVIICNSNGYIVSDRNENVGKHISVITENQNIQVAPKTCFTTTINGTESLCMYTTLEGYYILAIMTEDEAFFNKQASVYMLVFMEVIVFAILFAAIFILIKKLVVQNIRKINDSLSRITEGDLNTTIDVRDNEEFASLSDDINTTVTTLKQYIEEAEARFDKDLEIAKQIQHSVLPSVFPPYPSRKDFNIFASMYAAKEVGGDFYDFYLLDENHLAFLVADVSGKGIPGAMFMMTSKTLIKSHAESGLPVNEVFTNVNSQLCENNDAGMFVTAWMGILDLKTGLVKYANAGHNPPLVKHKDGTFEYIKGKANLVLAGLEGVQYREQELQLCKGDKIFLYTDGITEAHNINNELYSEERLLESLNFDKEKSVKEICEKVKVKVDEFVGEAEQFDDITMLCISLEESQKDISITVNPKIETVSQVSNFMETEMEKLKIPAKITMKLLIAIDEIYSNIVRFSGATEATIKIEKQDNSLYFIFLDNGKQYNPLEEKEPNVTASAEEREIGGLGIFMVKKLLDEIDYQYSEGNNILKLRKNIEN